MARSGKIYCCGKLAGRIEETPQGYRFVYDPGYLSDQDAPSISLTLPKQETPYLSETLFSFFYGLLAEGVLKDTQCKKLRLDENDHFGRLLKTVHADSIGNITVVEEEA